MPHGPTRIDFHRTKYGREILIDIAWIREMPTFVHAEPHWLSFYDVTLITRGRGHFWLDGHRWSVRTGQLFFTSPGQIRQWDVTGLDGLCLFFPAAFLAEFFSDDDFLHRLPYFHVAGSAAAVSLPPAPARALRRRLGAMRNELRAWRADSAHLLRARLYEALVELSRRYASAYRTAESRSTHPLVQRFRQLVDERGDRVHAVSDLAARLGVSPAHLSRLCRQHLGVSAKEVVQARLEVAARRGLLFSDRSAAQIAHALGFRDPSYFSRFFQRRTGTSPAQFRRAARSDAR